MSYLIQQSNTVPILETNKRVHTFSQFSNLKVTSLTRLRWVFEFEVRLRGRFFLSRTEDIGEMGVENKTIVNEFYR